MSPYPQAGELWQCIDYPHMMVLVLGVSISQELVNTKALYLDGSDGYRGLDTFRQEWKPIEKETK